MRTLGIGFLVICGIIMGSVAYYMFATRSGVAGVFNIPQPTSTFSPSPTGMQFLSSPSDTSALQAGGSSFLDPAGVYGFLYPADYVIDTQEEGKFTRIVKRGPAQRPQSEISDGVLLVFETISLNDQTLEEIVDSRIKQATVEDPTLLVQPKKSILLGTYPGFTYELGGYSSSEFLYIQKDQSSPFAVSVAILVADPTGKGYRQEVHAILSTLKLEK